MTPKLLACGIVAGPLFLTATLAHAAVRDGFDLRRHPISLLALGGPGWMQIGAFVVAGALLVACAIGLARTLRAGPAAPARVWGPRLVGAFGAGLVLAGVFVTDAGAGFPAGAPAGAPAMSWHGALHTAGAVLSFGAMTAACVVFARRYAALRRRGWAAGLVAAAVAVLVVTAWPDPDALSVRLVIATAVQFAVVAALAVDALAARRRRGRLRSIMASPRSTLDERFAGDDLDPAVWLPYHLPHWSSRADSAATYEVRGGELRLRIPEDQPLWCSDTHPEPLRVSCVQSAGRTGQQPFAEGLRVREEQPDFRGYTPRYGHVEVRMRGVVTPRSMVAFYLSGIEETPAQSGEICVAEIFGDAVRPGSCDVGMGIKAFRDPSLRQEFSADPLPLDVADFHTYGVDWRPGALAFAVDGEVVRRLDQAPDYPVQLMIGVFDFPAKAEAGAPVPVPELVVAAVRGHPLD